MKGAALMENTRMMEAAVFEGPGILTVKKKEVPKIESPADVLIRIKAVSICGTDTGGLSVPPKFLFKEGVVIGHECCGIVEETGSAVTNVRAGDQVVVHPNIWCEKCHYCRTGRTNLCENFRHVGDSRDGAMAEYLCVPEKLVYRISREIPPHVACLTEPLACVMNSTESLRIHPGQNAVVLGAGPIGLIFMMLYKAAGAEVIVADISEKRREFALNLGADDVFDPSSVDLESAVKEKTGTGADIVTDAVGFLLDQALKLVRKGGDIVLFGINEAVKVEIGQAPIVFNEISIHGKFIARGTFPLAVELIEKGAVPMEKLITHRIPLKDAADGIGLMTRGEGVKVIVEL